MSTNKFQNMPGHTQAAGASSARPINLTDELSACGKWRPGAPLRLHLGCGETHLEGYVNIDYPPSEHNVMKIQADHYADITALRCPALSVDEVRLHHVFEHFSRVNALALLVRWHQWLKIGGKLHIATPDLVGSARNLLGASSWKTKMGAVRHLAGDQSASWAYHIDHWFPERFQHTFETFGFSSIETTSTMWEKEPFLANVEATAYKSCNLDRRTLIERAERLLAESMVAPEEAPTFEVWRGQLHAALLDLA